MVLRLSRRGLLTSASAAAAAVLVPAAAGSAAARAAGRAGDGQPAAGTRPTDQLLAGHGPADGTALPELVSLEREYEGRIGAFALDTGSGATVCHRAGERFPLLSTFKALAAGAVLHRARHRDPGLLDRVLHWTEEDLVEYSPETSQHVADGMTVAAVCRAAIVYSDNTAGNLMLSLIGGPAGLTRYARGLGDPVTRLDRWETELNAWTPDEPRDTTTPAAMGRNLYTLTGRRAHPADRELLIGWLRESVTGGARIRAGLPAGWTIGDKTGSSSSYGAANDIAIAWPPAGAPLVLAAYTNRSAPDRGYDNAVIASTATVLARALGRL